MVILTKKYSWDQIHPKVEGWGSCLYSREKTCVQASTDTHSLLGYNLIATASMDTDQVLPSCCSHTCLLSATWIRKIKALINLGFPFKTNSMLPFIFLHSIWSLVRLLTVPLNYTVGPRLSPSSLQSSLLNKKPGASGPTGVPSSNDTVHKCTHACIYSKKKPKTIIRQNLQNDSKFTFSVITVRYELSSMCCSGFGYKLSFLILMLFIDLPFFQL